MPVSALRITLETCHSKACLFLIGFDRLGGRRGTISSGCHAKCTPMYAAIMDILHSSNDEDPVRQNKDTKTDNKKILQSNPDQNIWLFTTGCQSSVFELELNVGVLNADFQNRHVFCTWKISATQSLYFYLSLSLCRKLRTYYASFAPPASALSVCIKIKDGISNTEQKSNQDSLLTATSLTTFDMQMKPY